MQPEDGTVWDEKRRQEIAHTLLGESDRGCAIFGASMLHDELEALLRSAMRGDAKNIKSVIDQLFGGYAPLSSMSGRTDIAFALGLIPRALFDKLHLFRRLRNEFAHEAGPIDFEDARVRDKLRLLIADGKPRPDESGDEDTVQLGPQRVRKKQAINRIAFAFAVVEAATQLRVGRAIAASRLAVRASSGASSEDGGRPGEPYASNPALQPPPPSRRG